MSGDRPRITVITPSYNQGQFIEETIRSVLDQHYPALELIVIDGGSTDNTVEILRRYDSSLAYWTSERDRGQADAVNRGFARATGELVIWINSDDLLTPGSLAAYADAHVRAPNDVLLGDMVVFDARGPVKVVRQANVTFEGVVAPWLTGTNWLQPSTAVPRAVWEKAGPLDESYRYVFDREWACRLFRVAHATYLGRETAMFRLHEQSKTVGESREWLPEEQRVTLQYLGETRFAGRRDVMPLLQLREARRMLTASTYDRAKAFSYAREALRTAPRVAFSGFFAQVVARALTPYWLLRRLRLVSRSG